MAGTGFLELVESYKATLEEAETAAALLDRGEELALAIEAMAPRLGAERLRPLRGEAETVVGLLEAGAPSEAVKGLEALCARVSAAYVSALLEAPEGVEGDRCLPARSAGLLERMLEAAGPLRPVVAAMLRAPSVGGVEQRAGELLRLWPRLSRSLSTLYQAATMLERSVGASRGRLIAVAAALAEEASGPGEALERLERLSSLLADAAALARRAASLSAEASEAVARCRGVGERLPCRLAGDVVSNVVAARAALERLAALETPEALGEAVAEARRRLAGAEDAARRLRRLAARLRGKAASLAEAVEELLGLLRGAGLTGEEEELLGRLASEGSLDLAELHRESPRLGRAALRLCLRGLASCTVRL